MKDYGTYNNIILEKNIGEKWLDHNYITFNTCGDNLLPNLFFITYSHNYFIWTSKDEVAASKPRTLPQSYFTTCINHITSLNVML